MYGKGGSGKGEYNEPVGIAINQSTNNVYIAENRGRKIQRFEAVTQ